MYHDAEYIRHIGEAFELPGDFISAAPYGSGHINDTYLARRMIGGHPRNYIHQRINHLIFKDPSQLMDNIARVTGHLRTKAALRPGAEPDRETLTVLPARDGAPFFRDAAGNFWRTYLFITDAATFDICPGADYAREAAQAFGRFQADLADLPGERLHETIPWFHHTPRRFAALKDSIARDAAGRVAGAGREIDFCLQRRTQTTVITDLMAQGAIPERIAHNDTKLNNVMIDERTGCGVCVIDLDTVMSGCVLYDFGDMVRSTTRTGDEDERNPAVVNFDLNLFEALAQGYLAAAGNILNDAEREHLAFAGRLVTLTIGIRFLTDYLDGDRYFKTHRPGQNLDRTRVQFKMVENMEREYDRMRQIIDAHRG